MYIRVVFGIEHENRGLDVRVSVLRHNASPCVIGCSVCACLSQKTQTTQREIEDDIKLRNELRVE